MQESKQIYHVGKFSKSATLIVCLQLLPLILFGQIIRIDKDSLTEQALSRAIQIYDRNIGENSFIYTGRIYNDDKYDHIRGHQFFSGDTWEVSGITYKGERFDSVYLMYDIYNDLVLLENYSGKGRAAPVILDSREIRTFNLHGNTFINLAEDVSRNLSEGFYDVLYRSEKIRVYSKRRKEIEKSFARNDIVYDFLEKSSYYLFKDDAYHRIRNRRSVFRILKEYRKELKKYISNNNIDFKNDFERALVKVAKYIETL